MEVGLAQFVQVEQVHQVALPPVLLALLEHTIQVALPPVLLALLDNIRHQLEVIHALLVLIFIILWLKLRINSFISVSFLIEVVHTAPVGNILFLQTIVRIVLKVKHSSNNFAKDIDVREKAIIYAEKDFILLKMIVFVIKINLMLPLLHPN